MNPQFYILRGKTPVPASVMELGKWLETGNRTVAKDTIGDVHVSTIFLGINHRFIGNGPPLLFETMTFGGLRDQTQYRYSSWDDAEIGHATEVRRVRQSLV